MDPLRSNTTARLARYRALAVKYPSHDWRYWKQSIAAQANNVRNEKGAILSDSTDQYGRYLGDSHELVKSRGMSRGWYADNFQDELVVGGVARLRGAKYTLYIPVTHNTGCDGTVHYLADAVTVDRGSSQDDHDTAIADAARIAYYPCAEYEAEECREGDGKDKAEPRTIEAREEIHRLNNEVIPLIWEIKSAAPYTPKVRAALRDRISDYLTERREAFATIARMEENFWNAVQS